MYHVGDPVLADGLLDGFAVAYVSLAESDGGKLVLVKQEPQAVGRVADVESDHRSAFPDQFVDRPGTDASG